MKTELGWESLDRVEGHKPRNLDGRAAIRLSIDPGQNPSTAGIERGTQEQRKKH